MTSHPRPLEVGKFQYEATGVDPDPIAVRGGSQMIAARKIERARKRLPDVWRLDLMEDGVSVEWWEFNELSRVVVRS
jgi:hypothetical protein